MNLTNTVVAVFCVLTLGASGASKDSLCAEHARLSRRMSELIVLGVANPKNVDPGEFDKVRNDLADTKGKLERMGSSGAACP